MVDFLYSSPQYVYMKAVMKVLDEDSDGAIDREEFRKGLRHRVWG